MTPEFIRDDFQSLLLGVFIVAVFLGGFSLFVLWLLT